MADPVRADIDDIFGANNVTKWADLDNDADAAKITARVARAITIAVAWFNGKMRHGPFTVPMLTTDPIVVDVQARYAGVWLQSSRRANDSEEETNYRETQRELCENTIREILAGRLHIDAARIQPGGGPPAPWVHR